MLMHGTMMAWYVRSTPRLSPPCAVLSTSAPLQAGETDREDPEADWGAVLEAMQLRREQLEAVAEARLALEQTLLPIRTKKEVRWPHHLPALKVLEVPGLGGVLTMLDVLHESRRVLRSRRLYACQFGMPHGSPPQCGRLVSTTTRQCYGCGMQHPHVCLRPLRRC